MPGPHEAVTALVTEQHQKVKALIAEVERGSGDERASAYRAFQDFLAAHEAVEELVLHPSLMHVAEGNSVAQDRVDEEHQATSLVEQLEQFDVDDPRFATTFGELAGAVTQHAEAEEHQELTMLLPRLDEEVAGRVVTALQAVGPVADALGYDGPLGKRGFSATLDAAKAEVVRRGLTEPAGG
jgi:hemerythrin superfamily protein